MDPRDDLRSWHKGRGWTSQLDRVSRWHQRAADALDAAEIGELADDDWDIIYAFFMNAYHLGDWMIADGVVTKNQWNSFVRDHFELGLCRDLCNGVKHRRLNQPATVDPSPWTSREYVPGSPTGGERWYVQAGDERYFYPMRDLLDQILSLLQSSPERMKQHGPWP